MNPAAPVTSKRIASSLVRALVLRFLLVRCLVPMCRGETLLELPERVAHLRTLGLERLRAVEVGLRPGALAELHERVAEVVVRVTLGRVCRADTAQRRNGLLK